MSKCTLDTLIKQYTNVTLVQHSIVSNWLKGKGIDIATQYFIPTYYHTTGAKNSE